MTLMAKICLWVGLALSLWLSFLLIGTSPWSTFSAQGQELMSMEWGVISLIDLYAGFFLGLCLIWLFEANLWVKVLITLTLPTLGNPVLAIWLVFRFRYLKIKALGS
ncbi:hypothetical protein ACFOND_12060 [Reinekea marina]|uniref:DUF1475 domain-containing protein n=2 Tax=Reinekea marina TaxID=1310421 RepID=A0ABV7WTI4_9GAMM